MSTVEHPSAGSRPCLHRAWSTVPLAFVVLLGLAAYSNTFHAPFVFDDLHSIVGLDVIRDLWAFVRIGSAERPNRFVGYLSFALNYRFGGLDPSGYHAVNLAIHLANALLVLLLVRLAFRAPRLQGSAIAGSSSAVAFVAAALFVAHPLQTQSVTYVVQRLTSLATTFYLAAVVQYVGWRLRPLRSDRWRGALRYAVLLATVLLAMRTKEISFTLPLAIVAAEIALFGPPRGERLLALAPLLATMLVIPLTAMGYVEARGGGGVLSRLDEASRAQTPISRWDYATTQLPAIVMYLRLLAVPIGQNLDHDFPVYTSLLAPRVLASAALLAGMAAGALVLLLRRGSDPAARLVSFGIAWFFLGLVVESSFLPIADVLVEHRAYLPSVGILVSAVTAATWAATRRWPSRAPRIVTACGAALAVALGLATFQRNEVWSSEVALWSDVVAKSPAKARGYNSLGAALTAAGRNEEAVRTLETAIRIDPADPRPYYNLGRVHVLGGAYGDAVPLLAKAIELQSDWADPYVNIAAALNGLRRYDQTIQVLDGAGDVIGDIPEARFNLGVAYAALGRRDAAEVQLRMLQRRASPLANTLAAFMAR